jgi:hypothetical protein
MANTYAEGRNVMAGAGLNVRASSRSYSGIPIAGGAQGSPAGQIAAAIKSMQASWKARLRSCSRSRDGTMAIRYPLDRWGALYVFAKDCRVEMDNNAAGRAPRAAAL